MTTEQLRDAVRAYSVLRSRGVSAHPEPVYGRDERGYTESVGDRTQVCAVPAHDAIPNVVIATYRFDNDSYDYSEVAKDEAIVYGGK